MKKFINLFVTIIALIFFQSVNLYGDSYNAGGTPSTVVSTNEVSSVNNQNMQGQGYGYGYGEGGSASATGGSSSSDSIAVSGDSGAVANISTNSTANYETRTPPISMLPPYLPTYQHGGWGTIQAYFPNGPTSNDRIYERAFYPDSKLDMRELKSVITSIPYDGPLGIVDGLLNGVGMLFGGPNNFHHGRGFEIASSIVRKRRPENRPLYILIDSNINRDYLNKTGYTYVGKISLEGKVERNWDQVYKAAIAEAVPWDVDIMLVSGGMKGVTVGTTTTFPSAGGAYSQTDYSLSLLGGRTTGMTEGKGVAMVSAECYRYYPSAARSRAIPEEFYDRIHTNAVTSKNIEKAPQIQNNQQASPAPARTQVSAQPQQARVQPKAQAQPQQTRVQPNAQVQPQQARAQAQVPVKQQPYIGVNVSQELYQMAGF